MDIKSLKQYQPHEYSLPHELEAYHRGFQSAIYREKENNPYHITRPEKDIHTYNSTEEECFFSWRWGYRHGLEYLKK